ncbi:MAG: LysM peptidoglycan-binding domain-containing protein [Crocinitomicaceae bacterium]|nr:LysM peptidoglycan-binding domain-containing protein [Crocinitomicaceae bacterium]
MGTLTKMKIQAFEDPQLKTELKFGPKGKDDKEGTPGYYVTINPSGYSESFKAEYKTDDAQGKTGGKLKFTRTAPQELDLEFLFDRTGALLGSPAAENGVIDDICKFKEVVYEYSGELHKPPYLKLSWGSLLFIGIAVELNIEYKLFNPDGKPLRAVVKTKFKQFVDEEKKIALEGNKSPDLTHERLIIEGDTLPLLCKKIYGDSKYYLQVAIANRITNFRKLTPGQTIYFPPIDKQL